MVSLPPTASILILTSLQLCVFSIPLQAHFQKQRGKLEKQQFEALLTAGVWAGRVRAQVARSYIIFD